MTYRLGGPLRGSDAPSSATPEPRAADALVLDVSAVALAALPDVSALSGITSQTRVVVSAAYAGGALQPTPRALAEALAGSVPGAFADAVAGACDDPRARGRLVASARACLIAGATTVFELTRDDPPRGPGEEPHRSRAAVLVGRTANAIDVALEHDGAPGEGELVELVGAALRDAGRTFVAVVPSPFAGDEARWIAWFARVTPAPVPPVPGAAAHERVVAEAARELAAQAHVARLAAAPVAPAPPVPDVTATRRALVERTAARRALYALAIATRARTAEAVAIAADDHVLAPIASSVGAALGDSGPTGDPAALGLALERATLAACRTALAKDPFPEELPAILEDRGGAALRLLLQTGPELERARSLEELDELIEAANVRFLLDASPVIRVRAARWLASRVDLMEYSAIAPSGERTAAVARIKKTLSEARRGR